jgi:hypothetical protein
VQEINYNLTNWKGEKMIKEMVIRDITIFQMQKKRKKLKSVFGILHVNMWLDFSFE